MLNAGAGMCGCGAALAAGAFSQSHVAPSQGDQNWIHDLEKRQIKGAETPDWRIKEKARWWIKDMMDNMDTLLDETVKINLMQACGRSCYLRAFGVADEKKLTPGQIAQNLSGLKNRGFDIQGKNGVTTLTYSWGRDHQNPQGLILHDGYCMCCLVDTGPHGLSPTYCYCSTGYVKESFQRLLGPLEIELLDSLKMGGKDCIFKLTLRHT